MQNAIALILAGAQRDFSVTEHGGLASGHVVGLLTQDNVGEFIMVRGVGASPPPPADTVSAS